MTNLQTLTEHKNDFSFADICRAINSPLNEAKVNLKDIIKSCDDVSTLKAAAIKFDGINEFFTIEDRLMSLMGEDAYYSFADENDLT